MRYLLIALFLLSARAAAAQDAAAIYQQSCASCHDTGANRAPARDTLRQMQPERVLAALEGGAIPGIAFSGSVDGHLRAYSAADGKIVWDVDAVRPYETVNGVAARAGSLDGPGPAIVGGMLFVNSGYGNNGGIPGNVLLAFSVDGK